MTKLKQTKIELDTETGKYIERVHPTLTEEEKELQQSLIFSDNPVTEEEQQQLQAIFEKYKKKASKKDEKKAKEILKDELPNHKDLDIIAYSITFRKDKDYGLVVYRIGEENKRHTIQRFKNKVK